MPVSRPAGRIVFMFVLFAALFGTGQFHRISSSVIIPELDAELSLGAATIGLITGIYFLTAMLMQIPTGLCFDRFGARRTVSVVLMISIIGTLFFATAHTATGLLVGRALMGAGFASVLMGSYAVFARWIPVDRFSTFSAWLLACGSLGGMMATSPLAAAVEWIGWRPTIIGVTIMTVGLVAATFFGVRDAPPGYVDKGRKPGSLGESLLGLVDVLRDRNMRYILMMGIATFGPGMALVGLWSGPYLADLHGLDTVTRGHLLFAMAVAAPVGLMVIGPLDRLFNSRKKVVVVFGGLKAAAFFALAIWIDANVWIGAGLMIWVMFAQAYYVALQSHCRSLFPETMVGRATTSLNLVSVGGVALTQIATGAIIEAFPSATGIASADGYRWVFAFVGAIVALAVLAYTRVDDAPVRPA
jgi:predicted MFS family arabinose efflux permease